MNVVLAAIDTTPAAGAVMAAALGVGDLFGAPVEALHVREGPIEVPAALATQQQVPLRILEGPVESSLLGALSDGDAIAAVFGARSTPTDRRPLGHTALHVLERVRKPIVVVPPDAGPRRRPLRRLLLPLEGTEQSARPVAESLSSLIRAPVEVIVLHVFTPATVPRTLDRPARDLSRWGDEFVARFCPTATRIDLRSGLIGDRIADAVADADVDLTVLSWSQDTSPGHAAVIHDVLGRSTIPVLLLPIDTTPIGPDSDETRRRLRELGCGPRIRRSGR